MASSARDASLGLGSGSPNMIIAPHEARHIAAVIDHLAVDQ